MTLPLDVDDYLRRVQPPLEKVVEDLQWVWEQQRQWRIAEAHLREYAHRDLMGRDELEDYDPSLMPADRTDDI